MDTHAKALDLAKRPYLVVSMIDATADNLPIYLARALEVEGCFGQGATPKAAVEDLRLAMVDYFESRLEDGLPVPEPAHLIASTLGTTAQASFSYTAHVQNKAKRLQPKAEAYQAAYFLMAPAE